MMVATGFLILFVGLVVLGALLPLLLLELLDEELESVVVLVVVMGVVTLPAGMVVRSAARNFANMSSKSSAT
jgi:VIT1/CCC1 family predicted Fe2+/Mn2+ transporter